MNRNFRKHTAPEGADASPPSEAWLFAQAILGRPVPIASRAEADARAKREQLEWLATISTEHERQLRSLLAAEAEARRQRKQLEWLAQISTEHECKLRSLLRAEAEASEAQERLRRHANDSNVQEAQWDSGKHPRGAFPQNPGWWSPTDGSGKAEGPTSFLDTVIRRNRAVADLTGVNTPGMKQSSRLAGELQSAGRLYDEITRAVLAGLGTGLKAVVNGTATAIKSVATLGLSTSQLELIGVTKEDRENGYDTAVAISTASGQVLIAVGTAGIASVLSKGGLVARSASGALIAYDGAGNGMGVVQGAYDTTQNGVTVSNGAQVAGGLLGLGANVSAVRILKPSASARKIISARGGRYGHLQDPPSANSGKDFNAKQKKSILTENKRQNSGVLRDDRTREVLVPPQRRERGVPAPPNEAQVDHVYPKSRGGPNTFSNAEVRSRLNNIRKGKNID